MAKTLEMLYRSVRKNNSIFHFKIAFYAHRSINLLFHQGPILGGESFLGTSDKTAWPSRDRSQRCENVLGTRRALPWQHSNPNCRFDLSSGLLPDRLHCGAVPLPLACAR